MNYIVCEQPGKFELKEKPVPIRERGEALLKVKKVGICGTDLHAYTGDQPFFTYPRILGHELATEVIEIDTNLQGIREGDNVIVMPYVSCGECAACAIGKTNCCTDIAVLGVHKDGGMQQMITVPADILIPSNDLSDDEMTIAEPLAIGAHAIRRANLKVGQIVTVMGCGPIGIGLMKLAQIAGAKVIALDLNEDRLEYASKEIGVDHIINAAKDPIGRIAEITNGDMSGVVFDATGNRGALESGIDYMSHGGLFVLVGLSKGKLTFEHPKIHAKETTLMCSRNATKEDFEYVINVLKSGKFPTTSFITHKVDYAEMIEKFDSWLKPETGVIKAIVRF